MTPPPETNSNGLKVFRKLIFVTKFLFSLLDLNSFSSVSLVENFFFPVTWWSPPFSPNFEVGLGWILSSDSVQTIVEYIGLVLLGR